MSHNVSLRKKILSLVLILSSSVLILAVVSFLILGKVRIGGAAHRVISMHLQTLNEGKSLSVNLLQLHDRVLRLEGARDDAVALALRQKIAIDRASMGNVFEETLGHMQAHISTDLHTMKAARALWRKYEQVFEQEFDPLVFMPGEYGHGLYTKKLGRIKDRIHGLLDSVVNNQRLDAEHTEAVAARTALLGTRILTALSVFVVLAVAGGMGLLALMITRPLGKLATAARTIGRGELDGAPLREGEDEFGQVAHAFNQMKAGLREHLEKEREMAAVLAAAETAKSKSAEMSAVNMELMSTARALTKEKENVLAITDNMEVGVMLLDRSNRVMWANSLTEALSPLTSKEIVGAKCHMVAYGSDTPCHVGRHPCPRMESIQAGETRREIVSVGNGQGNDTHTEVTVVPLMGEDGRPERFVHLVRDVTRQVMSAKELEEAAVRAEVANQSKSQFLANMSHEIRTPMNAILGFVQLLRSTSLNPQQNDYLGTIESSGDHLVSLINDILDLSKVEAGEVALEKVEFNLCHLMEDVVRISRTKLRADSVELRVYIGDSVPPSLEADPTRLRQILLNILNNAMKFTERGEIELKVDLEEQLEGEDRRLRFSVSDTGLGIPAEAAKTIFDPFTQADMSTTRKYGGTGLGLSICRQFVEMMGGEITVDSEPGKGSTFSFTVVVKAVAKAAGEECIVPLAAAGLKGLLALVVDKDEKNGEILRFLLNRWEMELEVCTFFSEGSAWLLERKKRGESLPRVCLAGLGKDAEEGYAFARSVREKIPAGEMKMVVIAADLKKGVARESRDAGFDGFLPKPVLPGELLNVLLTVFGDNRESGQIVTRHLARDVSLNNVRVLVAEDNPINRKLIASMLSKFGCDHEIANDGRQAVDMMKEKEFDLVLMDLQMPVLGGADAAREIRNDLGSQIPIIALTAAVDEEHRAAARESGMNDFLTKPVNITKLHAAMERWVRDRGAARS